MLRTPKMWDIIGTLALLVPRHGKRGDCGAMLSQEAATLHLHFREAGREAVWA